MKELKALEEKIIERLDEIRNKENKTLNETEEYKSLQAKLGETHRVMAYIKKELGEK